jgi:hypothetical protein
VDKEPPGHARRAVRTCGVVSSGAVGRCQCRRTGSRRAAVVKEEELVNGLVHVLVVWAEEGLAHPGGVSLVVPVIVEEVSFWSSVVAALSSLASVIAFPCVGVASLVSEFLSCVVSFCENEHGTRSLQKGSGSPGETIVWLGPAMPQSLS